MTQLEDPAVVTGRQVTDRVHPVKRRIYRGGIADWMDSGEPTESVSEAPPEPDAAAADSSLPILEGPPLTISPSGEIGRVPARLS